LKAKIHPNKHMVNAGVEACISVLPVKKHARTHYAGTVILRDVEFRIQESGKERARKEGVRNVHAWAVGEVVGEFETQHSLEESEIPKSVKDRLRKVTYYFQEGYFRDFETHEEVTATKALYAVGRDFFYLP
jgi:hypothetical protein